MRVRRWMPNSIRQKPKADPPLLDTKDNRLTD